MDFKQVLYVPNVARIQIIIWPRDEKYFEKKKCAFEMEIDSINYYFDLKEKQDCSYQGEALNVPTAF